MEQKEGEFFEEDKDGNDDFKATRAVSHIGVLVRDIFTNISYIRPDGDVSEAVVVLIPGNPGAIGFYDKFIEHFYSFYEIPVYGISYAGHDLVRSDSVQGSTQTLIDNLPDHQKYDNRIFTLEQQISHKLAFILRHIDPRKNIILIGHSLGCYIALSMLKKKQFADKVCLSVLLFPVIERTMETTSGKRWVPLTQTLCAPTAKLAEKLPESAKRRLVELEATRRKISRQSRGSFCVGIQPLLSANGLKNMTRLATDLSKICKLNSLKNSIQKNKEKLVFYYGATDDWTPLNFYTEMKSKFPDVDIRLDNRGIEHAFVFRSSFVVAKIVADIISEKSSMINLELPNALQRTEKRFSMRRAQIYKHYSCHVLGESPLGECSSRDNLEVPQRSQRGGSF